MTNLHQNNMIFNQLKTWGIKAPWVLEAFANYCRTLYTPKKFQKVAYSDFQIPLEDERNLLSPKEMARMLQAINFNQSTTVLEIGTSYGFIPHILAPYFKHVISVDENEDLIKKLNRHPQHKANIRYMLGNASSGWEHGGPFDLIWINHSIPFLTKDLVNSLTPKGQIIVTIGNKNPMKAMSYQKKSLEWTIDQLFETHTPELPGCSHKNPFTFN